MALGSTVRPPQRLERDPQSEARSLQLFLSQNPGVDIVNNPEHRAAAEQSIMENTYGTARPTFASDFQVPQLQQQIAARDPFAFISKVAGQVEAQRPTGVDASAIEANLSKIKDPSVRSRIMDSIMGMRGQATNALLGRAENLFGQQTENLKTQLQGQQGLFDAARQQASVSEQNRLQQEADATKYQQGLDAEQRQYDRQVALAQLSASLRPTSSGRGGGGGGKTPTPPNLVFKQVGDTLAGFDPKTGNQVSSVPNPLPKEHNPPVQVGDETFIQDPVTGEWSKAPVPKPKEDQNQGNWFTDLFKFGQQQ